MSVSMLLRFGLNSSGSSVCACGPSVCTRSWRARSISPTSCCCPPNTVATEPKTSVASCNRRRVLPVGPTTAGSFARMPRIWLPTSSAEFALMTRVWRSPCTFGRSPTSFAVPCALAI
ncbi:hypothetical protein AL346_20510 [Chelatococcus sp. CO-6]|nr:hypothetical protein AL346_20510 [Chelatococcus sp. CO-6]